MPHFTSEIFEALKTGGTARRLLLIQIRRRRPRGAAAVDRRACGTQQASDDQRTCEDEGVDHMVTGVASIHHRRRWVGGGAGAVAI